MAQDPSHVRDFQPARAATLPADDGAGDEALSPVIGPARSHTVLESPTRRQRLSPTQARRNQGDSTSPFPSFSPSGRRASSSSAASSTLRQRMNRSNTVKTYKPSHRPNWEPGAEPGIDTKREEPRHGYAASHLFEACEITVIDFDAEHMEETKLENWSLEAFLDQGRQDWVACRWVCVNGLSWDVIRTLSNHKELHPLAVEDLMNTKSRTKADWYADHCYMVLTLQKLVESRDDRDDNSSESEDERMLEDDDSWTMAPRKRTQRGYLRKLFSRRRKSPEQVEPPQQESQPRLSKDIAVDRDPVEKASPPLPRGAVRTLHRYHGGPNVERIEYMEQASPLTSRNLAVSVEQVSMFLTADNTVLTFFEHSAQDILTPLTARLRSQETILRLSSDASMLVQAVIDAIVDLSLPVAAAYDDAIGALELDVLTDPDMSQPRELYILTSEITLLRNNIVPIASLVKALRDHRTDPVPQVSAAPPVYESSDTSPSSSSKAAAAATLARLQQQQQHQPQPASRAKPSLTRHSSHAPSVTLPAKNGASVVISPLAHTYLGDVEDHVITLTSSLATSITAADHLTSLIFNTVGAYQNENMRQLTLVTIFFLPLTFLTGYFGQNFHIFDAVDQHSSDYFWWIAGPVMFATLCFCLRNMIMRAVVRQTRRWMTRRRVKQREARQRRRRQQQQQQQMAHLQAQQRRGV